MSNLRDILAYAWNGDVENLKSSLDDEMRARADAQVADIATQVSSSLFNNTEEEVAEPSYDEPPQEVDSSDLDSDEETSDENL